PDASAPDEDFASSTSLVELKNGRQIVVAANKAGMVFALDPDREGKILWERRVGKGSSGGGVMWGPAIDGQNVYAAIAYFDRANPNASGGKTVLDIGSGRRVWFTARPPCAAVATSIRDQTAPASDIRIVG